jgi:flagellar biosynthesis GTPase FlhF
MLEDGPGDAESVAFIKDTTTIPSDRVAQIFLAMSAHSAALAAHFYSKFEIEVNHYFIEQGILPHPADFENEALRFAVWMYVARKMEYVRIAEEQEKKTQEEKKKTQTEKKKTQTEKKKTQAEEKKPKGEEKKTKGEEQKTQGEELKETTREEESKDGGDESGEEGDGLYDA